MSTLSKFRLNPVQIVEWINEVGIKEAIRHWARNPDDFCQDVLRMKPQKWQAEFMQAVSDARHGIANDGDKIKMRFAVKSGTGVGKTSAVACLILWHLACFADSKIPCTAPTSPQIKAVLWPEVRKWVQNIHPILKEYFPFDVQTDSVKLLENMAVARTARDEAPEAFQGFHSHNIMLLADEASGVPDAIFLAGQGVMSSKGAITILIGNPTRPAGWFYDAFHGDGHLYWTKTVACTDSEYVQPEYVQEMKVKHGENSYEFKVRVMGEFHLEDSGFIIPRSLLTASINRPVERDNKYIIWGVDVSAGRDKSALAKRSGNTLLEPVKAWGGKDVAQSVGIVVDEYYRAGPNTKPHEICVDVIGVGHGFVALLKQELKYEIDNRQLSVRGINVAERKGISDRYVSLRVELWARAREWFETCAVSIPKDDELVAQLCSVEWEISNSNGKWKIVDKKAGGSSPDQADAFLLTFAGRKTIISTAPVRTKLAFANKDQNMYAIGSASYLTNRG